MNQTPIIMESVTDTDQLPNYPIEFYRSQNYRYLDTAFLHWHFCCEMIFLHTGEQRVKIGGDSLTLSAGEAIYIHPRQVHEFVNTSTTGTDLTLLKFDTALLLSQKSFEAEEQYLRPVLPESGYRCLIFSDGTQKAQPWLELLAKEERERSFGFETRMRNVICMMISEMVQQVPDSPVNSLRLSTREQETFNQVMQYLWEHFEEDGLMERALEMCNLSYCNFAAKLKGMFGKTFTECLNQVRISHARQMLINSSDPVSVVAEACGYHDPGYFSRIFRKITGLPPQEYRAEEQKRRDFMEP